MVLRDEADNHEPFHVKVDGKWVYVDEEVLRKHPGGGVITAYRNKDATGAFHAFHTGSKKAYDWLTELKAKSADVTDDQIPKALTSRPLAGFDDVNIGRHDVVTPARAQIIRKNFEKLKTRCRADGLFEARPGYYIRKVLEPIGMMALAVLLQLKGHVIAPAILMGIAWQQLGWLIHEFSHQQVFRNRFHNDLMSYFVGDFLQGFSSGGWKEQHNVHHAATNVVGRDCDLDLMPFFATVATHLKSVEGWLLSILPYQHIYWTLMLPFLRLSWLTQSLLFVFATMDSNYFEIHRERAIYEKTTLAAHWVLVAAQLYILPDTQSRLIFFFVSQLLSGFLTAHVVTYNHYSTDKFSYDDPLLEQWAPLQIYTTRNMRPSPFIDWLWGGLNYQIEHHLFPTMPRHNLSKAVPLVQEFCHDSGLPYMVDDFFTGWKLEIAQFARVAKVAARMQSKMQQSQ